MFSHAFILHALFYFYVKTANFCHYSLLHKLINFVSTEFPNNVYVKLSSVKLFWL